MHVYIYCSELSGVFVRREISVCLSEWGVIGNDDLRDESIMCDS